MNKHWVGFLLLVSYLLLSSSNCAAQSCQTPQDWLKLEPEQEVTSADIAVMVNSAAIDLEAGKIPLSQPFSFKLHLCPATDSEIDRVSTTAIMPAHLHGMNYTPEVIQLGDEAQYQVEGFLFHMPGAWKITVSVYMEEMTEHFSIEVVIK